MQDHTLNVQWRFAVPPANNVRIVIEQRRDGPFRKHTVGGDGHYYTSVERYVGHEWKHITGTATGGHHSYQVAERVAAEQWERACLMYM